MPFFFHFRASSKATTSSNSNVVALSGRPLNTSGARPIFTDSTKPPKRKKRKPEKVTNFESPFLDSELSQTQPQSTRLDTKQDRHYLDAFFESMAMRAKQLPTAKQS